jgi:hypothetical protein
MLTAGTVSENTIGWALASSPAAPKLAVPSRPSWPLSFRPQQSMRPFDIKTKYE